MHLSAEGTTVAPADGALSPHAQAETTARRALAEARADLVALREERDVLNDRIRLLDAQVDTLASVVSAFERRQRAERAAAAPVRRGRHCGASVEPEAT